MCAPVRTRGSPVAARFCAPSTLVQRQKHTPSRTSGPIPPAFPKAIMSTCRDKKEKNEEKDEKEQENAMNSGQFNDFHSIKSDVSVKLCHLTQMLRFSI